MQFDPKHAEALQQIMMWRRDVRHFRGEAIPADTMARIKQSLNAAPSVGNSRPWRFVEVNSAHLRCSILANHIEAKQAAEADYQGERRDHYQALKLAGIDQAPWQLAVFCDLHTETGSSLGRKTMPETLEQSVIMAIHTLWLAARAENVGMGMVSIIQPHHIHRLLAVPLQWKFVAYLCLGLPVQDDNRPLLDRAGWQQNTETVWLQR